LPTSPAVSNSKQFNDSDEGRRKLMVQTGCCLQKCQNSTAAATAAAKHHAGTASTRAAAPPPQMRCSAHCVAHTCCPKAHSCHARETCIRNPHHDTITLGPSLQDSTDTLRNTQIGKQNTAARNHHTTASIMKPLIPVNHISMVQIPSHMLNHGSTHLHSTHNASPQQTLAKPALKLPPRLAHAASS
jgi:hypothetical protein